MLSIIALPNTGVASGQPHAVWGFHWNPLKLFIGEACRVMVAIDFVERFDGNYGPR